MDSYNDVVRSGLAWLRALQAQEHLSPREFWSATLTFTSLVGLDGTACLALKALENSEFAEDAFDPSSPLHLVDRDLLRLEQSLSYGDYIGGAGELVRPSVTRTSRPDIQDRVINLRLSSQRRLPLPRSWALEAPVVEPRHLYLVLAPALPRGLPDWEALRSAFESLLPHLRRWGFAQGGPTLWQRLGDRPLLYLLVDSEISPQDFVRQPMWPGLVARVWPARAKIEKAEFSSPPSPELDQDVLESLQSLDEAEEPLETELAVGPGGVTLEVPRWTEWRPETRTQPQRPVIQAASKPQQVAEQDLEMVPFTLADLEAGRTDLPPEDALKAELLPATGA